MAQAEKEGEAQKNVTVMMILEVDLKCYCCYKKVKKLLCKYPQIRDQVFHEDKNMVMITVVSCNPGKIRDELCCKGGKTIQTIEILEPKRKHKPQSPTRGSSPSSQDHNPEKDEKKTKPPPPPDDNREKVEIKNEPPPPPDDNHEKVEMKTGPPPHDICEKLERKPSGKAKHPSGPSGPACCQECYNGRGGGPCHYGHGPPPVLVCCQECYEGRGGGPCHYGFDRHGSRPISVCCQECLEGQNGGPCHYGYGRRVAPPLSPCFDTYGYPYTGNRSFCVTRCDDYFSEQNPQGCSIM